ncbi:MAG: triose-phosphate isomerase, partial [Bacteroidota bacterium]
AGLQLADAILQQLSHQTASLPQVVLMPPYTHLAAIRERLHAQSLVQLGAQNCHHQSSGAFTGEVSVQILRSVGVCYVLVGHSERRRQWDESATLLAKKVSAVIAGGLQPIFCCGEEEHMVSMPKATAFVQQQLAASLFHLNEAAMAQVIIAYEPVWAIGTGDTPTPAQVQKMHRSIREATAQRYSTSLAQHIPILYGGSCNRQNAASFFACPDVDGGLIGSASLQPNDFVAIVEVLAEVTTQQLP